jgi:hypothetical protein
LAVWRIRMVLPDLKLQIQFNHFFTFTDLTWVSNFFPKIPYLWWISAQPTCYILWQWSL